jgi:hypothetical protein
MCIHGTKVKSVKMEHMKSACAHTDTYLKGEEANRSIARFKKYIKHHVLRNVFGRDGMAQHIINLGTKWWGELASRPRCCTQGKVPLVLK